MRDEIQRWRSGYVMTAGVTCARCFIDGKRGEEATLMSAQEINIHKYGSGRFNQVRRARLLKHLRSIHPEYLAIYFPAEAAK